jgi:hypothetical protein
MCVGRLDKPARKDHDLAWGRDVSSLTFDDSLRLAAHQEGLVP